MLADGVDIVHRYMSSVNMIDHIGLALAFLGTNFTKPSTPLDFLKVRAVINSICKRWKKWWPKNKSWEVLTNQQVNNNTEKK